MKEFIVYLKGNKKKLIKANSKKEAIMKLNKEGIYGNKILDIKESKSFKDSINDLSKGREIGL